MELSDKLPESADVRISEDFRVVFDRALSCFLHYISGRLKDEKQLQTRLSGL